MASFKCKMCGGTLEINNETVAVCQYCGTKQTLPKLDDDRKANLYDRANHFRRNNEFDKAMGIYEQILNEDNTDAESYWSLVLCRYGIEYVEDPTSHKRIPTINRSQFTSVYDDEDYKSAIKYADGSQKEIYESEANTINEIQKRILAISQKEDPFDVFICYKETDNSGLKSPDSVLAAELYNELTREGFKVFFARITLEDKLGQEYEPYIFAALNSAKVMVVLGTKPEYFNAVWVKNEWSRYLALIKNGARKMLIPAYKDMDPYDLPEEFSHLQAQDMSKLGFMQDLIRGIKKIVNSNESTEKIVQQKVVISGKNDSIEEAYKKQIQTARYFLKARKWSKARKYFSEALKIDTDSFEANLGILFCKLKVSSFSQKPKCTQIAKLNEYKFALETADSKEKEKLTIWLKEKDQNFEQLKLKKQTIVNKVAKITSIIILTLTIIVFVFIPTSNYIRYSSLLKNGNTKEASTSFYSSKSIQFNFLTNRLFEKYGNYYFQKSDYVNAYNCYRYLSEDEHEETLYTVGCNLVKNKKYDVAADCFLQIYDYKDSKNYYNYCKGNQLLLEKDIAAYHYLNDCKNFLDTNNLFKNILWLNTLDQIQGEWYEIRNVYGSHLKGVNGSLTSVIEYYDKKLYIEIDGTIVLDLDDEYSLHAEEILTFKISEDRLVLCTQMADQLQCRIENNTTLYIEDTMYTKESK